jgi:hypothetical protein
MKHNNRLFAPFLATLVTIFVTGVSLQASTPVVPITGSVLGRASQSNVLESYGQLPLNFEANQGQVDNQVQFLSRGSGYNLFLTPSEAVLVSSQPERLMGANVGDIQANEQAVLRMRLTNANLETRVVGFEELPGKVNYFIGNDPTKWRSDVPTYAKIKYQDVYPGVDLVYYGNQQQLECDFLVAPGANPTIIKMGFEGASKLNVDAQGDLVLVVAGGQVRMKKPLIYQEVNDIRQEVEGSYLLLGEGQVGFYVGAYDTTKRLVIDPVLVYSTYLGGSVQDYGYDIAVDSSDNAYVTGATASYDFPIVNPLQPSKLTGSGSVTIFVAKLNSSGSALVYSTYLGGTGIEAGTGIAVDNVGNAYITGVTNSFDFPTVSPLQPTNNGGYCGDAFLTKLNSTGSELIYSTYLGGSGCDDSQSIASDALGNAYIVGITESTDFPTRNPVQSMHGACTGPSFTCTDAFVAKFNPSGSALAYSTYLGGPGTDYGKGIAVDAANNAYVIGTTQASADGGPIDFPTMNPLQPVFGGTTDLFITKLNSDGSAVVYSTYLGGISGEYINRHSIAVDASGNAYLTGSTYSPNFPITNPLPDYLSAAFVAKLNSSGSALVYSTYLGNGYSQDIAVDASGNVYAAGYTEATDFPLVNPLPATYEGVGHTFVTKLDPSGSTLVYSTYLGGRTPELFGIDTAIALDTNNNVYVVGNTATTDFPTRNPIQPTNNGASDIFIAKIADVAPNQPPSAEAGGPYTVNEGGNISLSGLSSVDPDPSDVLIYEWDLDYDGITVNIDATGPTPLFDATDLDGPSSRTVALRVTDDKGESDVDTAMVTIDNIAPTATFTNISDSVIEGESATLVFSNEFDPSAADTTAGFTYSYDCTDNGTFEASGISEASFDCQYPYAGTFTARGHIEDKDGGFTPYTIAVTVQTPAQAIQDIVSTVEGFNLQQGIDNGLDAKLDVALQALDDLNQNNDVAAINGLEAFINAVEGQRGKKLTDAQADELIEMAQAVIYSLTS